MGKLDDKKKQERDSLLMAAFALFTQKGINDTSISDIAKKANMAKGTFYLYFKDKFDIRDKLIADKARQVFCRALEEMNRVQLDSLEDHVIFLINSVINQLNQNKNLLKFISKNLSWEFFRRHFCWRIMKMVTVFIKDIICFWISQEGCFVIRI